MDTVKTTDSTIRRTEIKDLLAATDYNSTVMVKGWVRAFRANRFIALNDGSCFNNIQVVVDFENLDEAILKKINFHACLAIEGLSLIHI